MSEKPKKGLRLRARWRAINGYFRFGLVMSGLVLALVAMLALGTVKVPGEPAVPRWQAFWNASPNEIGDTIAGVAGTLAFLWIIVTVMIQGSELRLQRRELAMTRRELKAQREASEKMVIAQDAQVVALKAQAAIFEDERTYRVHQGSKDTLDQLIKAIAESISEEQGLDENFIFESLFDGDYRGTLPFLYVSGDTSEEKVASLKVSLEAFQKYAVPKDQNKKSKLKRKSYQHLYYRQVCNDLDYVLELTPRLAEDQEIRVQRLGVRTSQSILKSLLDADIWNFDP